RHGPSIRFGKLYGGAEGVNLTRAPVLFLTCPPALERIGTLPVAINQHHNRSPRLPHMSWVWQLAVRPSEGVVMSCPLGWNVSCCVLGLVLGTSAGCGQTAPTGPEAPPSPPRAPWFVDVTEQVGLDFTH